MSDLPANRDPDATRTSLGGHQVLTAETVIAGRYRAVGLIGVGAMGMVYRVHDERLHLDVALKVLRPEQSDARMLERFEHELVLARQVTHKNVVRIHDIGQDGERHFLTMDLVDGRSLKQILDERRRLEIAEVVTIAGDLAAALGAAHAQSVVHRDLKPANVLVDDAGHAYVTDFGVARSMHRSGLTKAGHIVGTIDYLAPEQARGAEVDGRADIYSLGLIMFEMLTGERAFRGESPEEILAARSVGHPRRIADLGVKVPVWLQRIVDRCLASNPKHRYQDAGQLAADLAGGKVSRRPTLRRIGAPAAAAVFALAVAGAAWWYYTERETASQSAQVATPTVAVLPLAAQSGSADTAWLATGLAEMLAHGLAESTDLQVTDSLRVFRTFEDLHLTPERLAEHELNRIGELLDVDRLVTGTVREAGGVVRIELRLIDRRVPDEPATTMQAQATASSELFSVADRLSDELRTALAARPAPAVEPSLSKDGEAMAAYARGLDLLLKGDSVAAATALQDAVGKDPGFTTAWVRLAGAYDRLGYDDRALEAARQAVSHLTPRSGRISFEARALEAALSGNFEQAQQTLAALVARYPHDVEARVALAEAYGEQGQLDRAQVELKTIVAGSPNHPRASYLLGKYAILAGDSRAAADDYLVRALVIQNRLGNLQGRADAENALGIAQFELGRLDEAEKHYLNAIELRRQIGDERGVAAATANVARIQLRQGKHDAARRGLQQSLVIIERIGDRQMMANLHNEIGALEERQGRYHEALARYRQSLALLRELGNQRALAESYNNIGFTYYQLGDFDNAAVYAQQAMQLYEKTGNREGQMFAGQTVGLLALARAQWDAAEKALLDVLQLGREFKDPLTEAVAQGHLGRAAQYQGRYAAAQSSIRDGLKVLEPSGDARGLVELKLLQADLSFELGMLDAGGEALREAQGLLESSDSLEQRAEWLRLDAVNHLLAGEPAEARRIFDEAASQAGVTGSAIAHLATGLGAADAALAEGDHAATLPRLEKLHRDAKALGHVVLILQSGELLARAQESSGRLTAAEKQLRASLRDADGCRPCAVRYRLHTRLAAVLDKLGRGPDAKQQLRAAVNEVERLRQGLDVSQQESFAKLAEVRKIAGTADAVKAH
ncbi:MAG: protein kinase domain-containing protein [Steroidobacteraceae bacterium]